jgi:hypothetical protein
MEFLEALVLYVDTRVAASKGLLGTVRRGGSWELRVGAPGVLPLGTLLTAASRGAPRSNGCVGSNCHRDVAKR